METSVLSLVLLQAKRDSEKDLGLVILSMGTTVDFFFSDSRSLVNLTRGGKGSDTCIPFNGIPKFPLLPFLVQL